MGEQCRDCKFYTVRSDDRMKGWSGYCRRFPPVFKESNSINDGWPNVGGQSWCGEFVNANKEGGNDAT